MADVRLLLERFDPAAELAAQHEGVEQEGVEDAPDVPGRPRHDVEVVGQLIT